ncbi:aminoacetone oxidase family FAD-binding enzyme [Methylovulum psychrotolerans]|uniref:Aminoacetone oxidase family FAD-binding enzyme n=1 Tax=Methylovulum psychrotolerans TaxID=1704499 RepID=A0A1Z4C561_9GAMM|nr:aminoacetone oxidase family FAD-binding enzyme [Methylovulum psychrotolerans]
MTPSSTLPRIAIIGGGPAGLMAAEFLSRYPVRVDVYDSMPSVGRKFLMAGKGGMNITHAEPFPAFVSRYGEHQAEVAPLLEAFPPTALRAWLSELGIETFVGSSGRVFPTDMKAAPLLRSWLRRLREAGVVFHTRWLWTGWQTPGQSLVFQSPQGGQVIHAEAVIFALGGGSWPQLGSTGQWQEPFRAQGIAVQLLQPANCGFTAAWSDHFKSRYAGQPLKTLTLRLTDSHAQTLKQQGECVITETGIEGGLIYSLSAAIRNCISQTGQAVVYVDLLPDKDVAWLHQRLAQPRGKTSLANVLRKLGLDGVKAGLVRELVPAADIHDAQRLAQAIKALPLTLLAARPLAEAISSAGGVDFAGLNEDLMLKSLPGVFCAGEMLDWEAPTGGYLLSACFATGRQAGLGAWAWLADQTATVEPPPV